MAGPGAAAQRQRSLRQKLAVAQHARLRGQPAAARGGGGDVSGRRIAGRGSAPRIGEARQFDPAAPFLDQGRDSISCRFSTWPASNAEPHRLRPKLGAPLRASATSANSASASIASLRHALARASHAWRSIRVTVLPLLGEPLVDAGAREIAPGAGTEARDRGADRRGPVQPRPARRALRPARRALRRGRRRLVPDVHPGRPAGLRSLAAVLRGTTPKPTPPSSRSLLRLPPPVVVDAVEEPARSAPFWPPSLSGRVAGSGELGGRSRTPGSSIAWSAGWTSAEGSAPSCRTSTAGRLPPTSPPSSSSSAPSTACGDRSRSHRARQASKKRWAGNERRRGWGIGPARTRPKERLRLVGGRRPARNRAYTAGGEGRHSHLEAGGRSVCFCRSGEAGGASDAARSRAARPPRP